MLDANILIRAVLGARVFALIRQYHSLVSLVVPKEAITEARDHLPEILSRRQMESAKAMQEFDGLARVVVTLQPDLYSDRRAEALARIGRRDPEDWPVLAAALALDCRIWTEDADFFGAGVATWMTALVEIYLRAGAPPA